MNPSHFDVNYRGTIGFDTLPYFSICFVIFSYVGTWCGEHTSGEGASSDK